jgi:hypothetical protein
METNPKKQRQHFYRDYASGQWSMSELCGWHAQDSGPAGLLGIAPVEPSGKLVPS